MEKSSAGKSKKWIGFVKRHKGLVALAAVVVLALGGWLWLRAQIGAAAGSAAPETIALQKRDLEQVVSGTGYFQSTLSRGVTASVSYSVKEIYVRAGDRVEAGDTLALLDTADIDKAIAETRDSLADAEAADARARAQAERKLQDAKNQYDIDAAPLEAAVADKLSALGAAKLAADASARAAAGSAALASPEKAAVDSADASALPAALAAYNALWAEGSGTSWLSAYNGAYAADPAVPAAQVAHDAAVSARDKALRSDSLAIENARDAVANLKPSAESFRTTLQNQLKTRADCAIKAPVAGMVTAVNAKVGSAAGGAAAAAAALFTVEDADSLEITASIAEYDAVDLAAGMGASLTSDALDGAAWRGTVTAISPKATDASGNFTVTVLVTSPVGELKIGMSGKINIQIASKAGVFAVPYDAVTADAEGNPIIYVLDSEAAGGSLPGGQSSAAQGGAGAFRGGNRPGSAQAARRAIRVTTGMETDYYVEISGPDLREGLLVLADPEGKNVSTGSGGGMFTMGGGGRF